MPALQPVRSFRLFRLLLSRWDPSGRTVLLGLAAALFIFIVTHFMPLTGTLRDVMGKNGGRQILDLQPALSADAVYQRLSSFGAAGREAYLQMLLTMDILFPAVFTTFMVLLSLYAINTTRPRRLLRLVLLLLPLGYLIPDLAENFSIAWIIQNYPQRQNELASAIGHITILKRVLMYTALALPLALLFLNLMGWRKWSE